MGDAKRKLVQQWLLLASDDLGLARMVTERDRAFPTAAAYHCQQAAEKALKGFLVFWGEDPTDSLDVGFLLQQAERIEPCFATWRDAAEHLTSFVAYSEDPPASVDPDSEQVDEALDDADCIYKQVLAFLPREVHPETPASHFG